MLEKLDRLFFGARTHQKLQIDALDGVRGLAVFFVLFSHGANGKLVFFENIIFAGKGSGQFGVWLFFVLSAFLLTRGLIKRDNETLKSALLWLDYSVRRILRIFPLFSVVIAFIWLVTKTGLNFNFKNFVLRTAWEHLTLQAGQEHLWTIGVEFRYYLILPLFVLVYAFVLKRNFWLTTALVFVIFAVSTKYFLALPFWQYLSLFIAGSYFAVFNDWYLQNKFSLPKIALTIAGILIIGYSFIMMPNTYAMLFSSTPRLGARYFPQWGLLFGSLIFIVINEDGLLNRIFANKAFRFVGIVSFSMYLWHWFTMIWVVRYLDLPTYVEIFVFYGSSLIIAGISFLIFEKPLASVRILKQRDKQPEHARPIPSKTKVTTA
jgi:peptidoglycan/LPS O-acetylase OafA/YrhL